VGQAVSSSYNSGSNAVAIPAGVSSVHVRAVGGSGQGGGRGAVVAGDLAVTGGSTLYAVVGAGGGVGGAGSTLCVPGPSGQVCVTGGPGGQGGGESDVRTSATDPSSRLLVAAGGGGAGGDGQSLFGGAYGPGAGGAAGAAGTAGGGFGGGGLFGGGGGGGGYAGGGAGGGGGSSLVPAGGTQGIDSTGVPLVQVSYTLQPTPAQPTAKQQCKDGGWRAFPQFANQGRCVSFVQTGR
jgi:hypothetical protein